MKELIIIALVGSLAIYGLYHLLKTAVLSFAKFIIKLRKEFD